jgi:hypothetical protein
MSLRTRDRRDRLLARNLQPAEATELFATCSRQSITWMALSRSQGVLLPEPNDSPFIQLRGGGAVFTASCDRTPMTAEAGLLCARSRRRFVTGFVAAPERA